MQPGAKLPSMVWKTSSICQESLWLGGSRDSDSIKSECSGLVRVVFVRSRGKVTNSGCFDVEKDTRSDVMRFFLLCTCNREVLCCMVKKSSVVPMFIYRQAVESTPPLSRFHAQCLRDSSFSFYVHHWSEVAVIQKWTRCLQDPSTIYQKWCKNEKMKCVTRVRMIVRCQFPRASYVCDWLRANIIWWRKRKAWESMLRRRLSV